MHQTKWPNYEALDAKGLPYEREAMLVNELPMNMRSEALRRITLIIEDVIGLKFTMTKRTVVNGAICFGVPLFNAFDITPRQVAGHERRYLLVRLGHDLPLALIDPFDACKLPVGCGAPTLCNKYGHCVNAGAIQEPANYGV